MKRVMLSTVLLVLLAAPFAWGADRIRIGYSSISGSYIGIWVAHDAGLFAKEGLEDQIILIPSGSQLAQVTVAGEVEVGSFNGSSAMAAADQRVHGQAGEYAGRSRGLLAATLKLVTRYWLLVGS